MLCDELLSVVLFLKFLKQIYFRFSYITAIAKFCRVFFFSFHTEQHFIDTISTLKFSALEDIFNGNTFTLNFPRQKIYSLVLPIII